MIFFFLVIKSKQKAYLKKLRARFTKSLSQRKPFFAKVIFV